MFESIIGHDDKKTYFENIIKKHNISHSYIFYGEDGIGKLTFAKEFAKELLSTDILESCPDYKYISKSDDKKDIVIEQIRKEITQDVYIAPICGEYKVYIINDAECLNIASQNALLKTLEEPPKHVVLILICSNINKILTTILSRTNKINFSGIDKDSINKYITNNLNVTLSQNVLEYVNGSIGKAINIVQNDLILQFEEIDRLVCSIEKKDVINAIKISENIKFDNIDKLKYFEYVMYSKKKYSAISIVERAILRMKNNGNYDIVIDNMILKIIDKM